MTSMKQLYVGIDVGATYVRAGLFDEEAKILKKIKRPFPTEDFEGFLKKLVTDLCGDMIKYVTRVGIGSIGPLDIAKGIVPRAPNAPIKSFNLVSPIRELGLEVVVANDASAAAWGEYILGLGKGRENLLYVTISTGIGGGVVVDGELLIGKDGNAHEIGHIVVDYTSNLRCGCGGYGHWEALASGANMPKSFISYVKSLGICKDIDDNNIKSPICEDIKKGRYISSEEIFSRYRSGDLVVIKYIEEYLMPINAAGLASAINVYDPEVLVIGGGVALNNKEVFIKGIERNIDRYLTVRKPEIMFTNFGDDVGIYGAVSLAMRIPRSLKKYVDMWNSV
ncbi:MAG: ROK family protein [Sulfolobales archaeon]